MVDRTVECRKYLYLQQSCKKGGVPPLQIRLIWGGSGDSESTPGMVWG